MEAVMAKYNRRQSDRERFGKCVICESDIPIEYYFGTGDKLICYECGSDYTLLSKDPVKLQLEESLHEDGYLDELLFDEY